MQNHIKFSLVTRYKFSSYMWIIFVNIIKQYVYLWSQNTTTACMIYMYTVLILQSAS